MDNMSCIRRGVSVVAVPHGTSSRSSRRVCGFVVVSHGTSSRSSSRGCGGVRASMVDSYESSSDFVKRMEQAWLISEQPMPVACSSCDSDGEVECHWCRGTGFFILGDNILCQVPSRNTNCVICAGKQPMPVACSSCDSDGEVECHWCRGTGFFILGDNILCQVPSRNTNCVICAGKGSMRCSDCKGTGFRAGWLGKPPISK